jgi:hypothetical protein
MEPSKFLDSRGCGETGARRLACPELAPRQAPRMVPVYRRLTLRHSTPAHRPGVSESEVDDLSVEVTAEQLGGFCQLFRLNSRQIAVNDPLIIADQSFLFLR